MKPVFLSASIPDPKRNPRFFETADPTAISEAVIGLATVVLPQTQLVFGGHPAISPLVRFVAERFDKADNVIIYQSDFFRHFIPPDSRFFENLIWTEAVPGDRDESLRIMREAMIGSADFGASVFIGGMEGVKDEHEELQRQYNDQVPAYPVASTGGAALELWEEHPPAPAVRAALLRDLTYPALFARLLADH